MLTTLILASVSAFGAAPVASVQAASLHPAPYIQLWTSDDDIFERGDAVRVYFETDANAYITVFRVDTDGRVRVLFPLDPWDDNYARGGTRYQIEARHGGHTFRVDDYPGQGYLFAVASADPFRYAQYVRGDHWEYHSIAEDGRIAGDPYVALGELLDHIVPANYVAYAYDVLPYYVERRYEYPRFLCYDCHAYAAWPDWDPYAHSCIRFRIVIYDDPYYYPARAYAGTRVVYRPRRTVVVPRYVFKDRQPDDRYVVRVRERPVDADGQRRIESGATRRVLTEGARLPVPVPADATRRTTVNGRRLVHPVPGRRGIPLRSRPQLERRDPNKPPRRSATPERRKAPSPDARPSGTLDRGAQPARSRTGRREASPRAPRRRDAGSQPQTSPRRGSARRQP